MRVIARAVLLLATVTACLVAGGCARRAVSPNEFHLLENLDVPTPNGPEGCGAQAVAAALAYLDPSLDAQALCDELPWHDLGATPAEILVTIRSRRHTARILRGHWALLGELVAARRPALLMFDIAPEDSSILITPDMAQPPPERLMHWGVLSGVARDASSALIASAGGRHLAFLRPEFLDRWSKSDYCTIVVGRPGEPP